MDLSIIIVNYNTQDLIEKCLKSIIKRTELDSSDFEIIVIDNNSTDHSVEVLKKLSRNYQDFPLKLIYNNQNLGFAKAVNQGIEQSSGKHVLLLNSDAQVKRGSIKKMLGFVDNHPKTGVVGLRLINNDGTVQASCFHFPTFIRAVQEFWFGKKGTFGKYYPKTNQPTKVDAVVGAAFLITQKALKKVGKLDEKYFMYFEDIDYCREIKRQGLEVFYLPNVEIIHQHGASGKSIPRKTNKWLVESSKHYHGLVKHYLINFIIWSGQKCQRK